jgi:MFS transporter, SP family, sugar:H+ symporter
MGHYEAQQLTCGIEIVDVNGANWGYKTAFLFVGLGTVTVLVIFLFVPEPSMRNSAEMDEMYEKGVPAWRMSKYVTDVQRAAGTAAS